MTRFRQTLEEAEAFVTQMPTEKVGLLFLKDGKVVQPDPDHLDHYEFTMRFSAHPERRCAFESLVARLGLIHARCDRGSPWQNGIVERSHRTDNEELFRVMRFSDSEERRYQLKLWDFEYNAHRPHQGLGPKSNGSLSV